MQNQYALPLDDHLTRRETYGAEDFMISTSNAEAVEWVLKRDPSSWSGSALIVYGAEACGKTHLLTAWRDRHQALELTCGDTRLEDIVTHHLTPYAICLDDAQNVTQNPALQEWLQHAYNASRAAHMPFLLTARTAPALWGLSLKDIASRLNSCQAIAIHEPDDALMRALLMKQFSDRQLLVDDGVIEYLARRLERTSAAIRKAVQILDQKSLESQAKITIPFIQSVGV